MLKKLCNNYILIILRAGIIVKAIKEIREKELYETVVKSRIFLLKNIKENQIANEILAELNKPKPPGNASQVKKRNDLMLSWFFESSINYMDVNVKIVF